VYSNVFESLGLQKYCVTMKCGDKGYPVGQCFPVQHNRSRDITNAVQRRSPKLC